MLERLMVGARPSPRRPGAPNGGHAVSVVINTLNRRDHLERALLSLRAQTYRPFEVIVVNGPSFDGTAEMLDRFAARARLFSCPEANLGQSRNIGVQQAAADIVAFIDDDAVPEPDWLGHLALAYDDPRVVAVGGPVFDVPLDRIEWRVCTCTRLGAPNTASSPPIEAYNTPGSDPFPYLAGCNMSYRRAALQRVGGFNAMLAYGYDDVDVCRMLNDAGYAIRYCEDALVHHDRAMSAVRDERRLVTDPYSLLFSRAVFTLQCAESNASSIEIDSHLDQWAAEWVAHSAALLEEGLISANDHDLFARRASSAVVDGRAAGCSPRPHTAIRAPRRREFRQYE